MVQLPSATLTHNTVGSGVPAIVVVVDVGVVVVEVESLLGASLISAPDNGPPGPRKYTINFPRRLRRTTLSLRETP